MMKINEHQADKLAAFIASFRADWDPPGIKAALARARDRGDVATVAIAAIRAASEPSNRTPAVITHDGPHWRERAAETGQRPPVFRRETIRSVPPPPEWFAERQAMRKRLAEAQ